MENLKSGDILICRGHSWISKAIMAVTRGKWSHTATVAQIWGVIGVIEAQKNGVNFKLWQKWRNAWNYDFVAFRYKLPFNEKELMLYAFSFTGETKYDWFTFFRRAFGKRKQRNEMKEESRSICSENTCRIGKSFDKNMPNCHDITPTELYNYLKSNPNWEEIVTLKQK
jgi:hypothetical protein